MKAALLLVDVQNDFCPGGALAVPGGDRIVAPLNRLSARFAALGRLICASRDWHPEVTGHFARYGGLWPVHCVAGSAGAAYHPALQLPATTLHLIKGDDPQQDDYSAWSAHNAEGNSLATLLAAAGIDTLYVGGLATDYCVKATVLDACAAGLEVVVIRDAIAGVELAPGDCERAMAAMAAAGATFCTAAEIA